MAIFVNGSNTAITTVEANGQPINTVVANGVTVFSAAVATATPSIIDAQAFESGFGAQVY